MAIERTLSIIKPDAVAKNVIGQIYARFEAAGLKVVAARMAHLSRLEAEQFYAVHKERPFFKDLVDFMISGPVMIQALEGENAILKNRELMGATDPKKAEAGTIRADFADSIDANAVHGSDAAETAQAEVGCFFPGLNIYSRGDGCPHACSRTRGIPAPWGRLRSAHPGEGAVTTNLLEFDLDGLAAFCQQLGEKRFRATQVFRWIHQRGASDFDAMSDLAKALRDKLKGCARVEALPVISEHVSSDGTVKWLFDVGDGNAVEAVFIPEDDRGTLCISSQAGCAVGCRFCSTGHQGFSRNLTTGEIVAQLWFAEHSLRQRLQSEDRVISNVVMMGMGEPLQNYSALVPALRVMLDDHGYGLSRRRVTVSTSGVVPMMDRLSVDCPVALAVSLHAPNDPLRDNLVPLNRKYPIEELLAACNRYLAHAPRDFITFEYCMLDGVNDQVEHARQLIELVKPARGVGVRCKFNLIPFNPFPASGLLRSPQNQVLAFAKVLSEAGIVTTVRKTRGDDIDAACGQLAGDVKDRTRAAERMAKQRTIVLKPVT